MEAWCLGEDPGGTSNSCAGGDLILGMTVPGEAVQDVLHAECLGMRVPWKQRNSCIGEDKPGQLGTIYEILRTMLKR